MSVISERFADELDDKDMRHAFLGAQTRVAIAHQIRALRNQRDWSQGKLGRELGKPQSNVSRLENVDGEEGKYSLTTLLEVAAAFDVGLSVRFIPYEEFVRQTEDLSPANLQVPSFTRAALQPLCHEASLNAAMSINVPVPAMAKASITIPNLPQPPSLRGGFLRLLNAITSFTQSNTNTIPVYLPQLRYTS
jgi:transcriptional regulator with XRE-family HTH domain